MFCLLAIIIYGDEKGHLPKNKILRKDASFAGKMEAVTTILEGFSQCAFARITETPTPPPLPLRHIRKKKKESAVAQQICGQLRSNSSSCPLSSYLVEQSYKG